MSLSDALAALEAIQLPGVASYGGSRLPRTLQRASLPALLTMPLALPGLPVSALPPTPIAGPFTESSAFVTIDVRHVLLLTSVQAGVPLARVLPQMVQHIDAVLAAYHADPTLDGALAEPLHVRVAAGIVPWAGEDYYGCTFVHEWRLRL